MSAPQSWAGPCAYDAAATARESATYGVSREARRTYLEVLEDVGDSQLAADAADLMDEAVLELEGWA